ncbi:hypothetical protein ACIOKD_31985 [Streptomyces sp. NPDC087844]|uniref:hypothetical protein n=1 Tax=Streptomyces sp. NPDC087844 TaxID=3365805 RepID=UPI0037F32BC2
MPGGAALIVVAASDSSARSASALRGNGCPRTNCATRLDGDRGHSFGTLPADADADLTADLDRVPTRPHGVRNERASAARGSC